jgi:phenylalanyl-tRNA synthetase beta subunit
MDERKKPNEVPVKEDYYRRVFENEYNICIEPPSVDNCNICAKLNIKIKEIKETGSVSSELPFLKRDLKLQLKKQQAAQDIMKIYTSNTDDSLEVIAVYLQQALPTPKLT